MSTRAAVLASYRAACRRQAAIGHLPINASTLAGAMLDTAGNTTRARDLLDGIAKILDIIDAEGAQEDRGPGLARASR